MARLLKHVEREFFLQGVLAREQVREGFAPHVFQGHEAEFAAIIFQLAVVIRGHHVIGLDRFGGFRFIAEAREEFLVIRKLRPQNLDGYFAVIASVIGKPHR